MLPNVGPCCSLLWGHLAGFSGCWHQMQKVQLRGVGLAAGSKRITGLRPHPHCSALHLWRLPLAHVDCPKVGYLFLSSPFPMKEIKDSP